MTFFNSALDPILRPLLSVGVLFTIFIISVVVTLITTMVYKYATDQTKLRKLKADMKRYQKKAMAAKDNPEKAMAHQKVMMKLNGEYMRSSMKSMLYTFIPILFFFGWLGANVAFAPLMPGMDFSISASTLSDVDGTLELMLPSELSIEGDVLVKNVSEVVIWEGISGPAGEYDVSIKHSNGEEQFVNLLITEDQRYINPIHAIETSEVFETITVGNEKLKVFGKIPLLKDFPVLKNINWFWTYFLFSIVFSTSLRKAMKLA